MTNEFAVIASGLNLNAAEAAVLPQVVEFFAWVREVSVDAVIALLSNNDATRQIVAHNCRLLAGSVPVA